MRSRLALPPFGSILTPFLTLMTSLEFIGLHFVADVALLTPFCSISWRMDSNDPFDSIFNSIPFHSVLWPLGGVRSRWGPQFPGCRDTFLRPTGVVKTYNRWIFGLNWPFSRAERAKEEEKIGIFVPHPGWHRRRRGERISADGETLILFPCTHPPTSPICLLCHASRAITSTLFKFLFALCSPQ
jgi:hypothetical protein